MEEVGMCGGVEVAGAVICMDHCAAQVWVLFFWPGPFWPFTSTLAGCGGLWIVSARRRHKGAFVPRPHHIHHVMPVRQIWLDVSVTLMWVQSASGPEIANFTLYCLFCSIDMGVEARGREERWLGERRRREKGEQAGGSPHYLQEQIHNKFPHSTKPGRDDWHYFTPGWTKALIWAEYQMNGASVDSIQTILISLCPLLFLLSSSLPLSLTLTLFFQLQLSCLFCPQHSRFTE